MKKLALIFSLAFFAFVVSSSAQSSVSSSDKETTETTAKVKGDDDWSKGCGAYSGKSAKAKCCAKPKSMAKKTSTEATPSSNSEAVVSERKSVVAAEAESK